MKKKAQIRSVAGLPNKAGKTLRSKKGPLQDPSEQDVPNLLKKLTRQNKELLRAQQEIETSRQRYADIYDFAPVAYFVFDAKGRIVEVNSTGALLLGKTKSSLTHMHFKSFISRGYRGAFDAHCLQTLEEDGVKSCELKLNGPDGKIIFARLQSSAADNDSSSPIMIRTAVTDITELRRAEELTKHLASFPQLNPNPVIKVDSSGTIVYANKAAGDALEQLGMDREDLTPFLPADIDVILGGLKKKSASSFSRELTIKDKVFLEAIHIVPQFNVGRLYILEITERKKAEEALRISETRFRLIAETSADIIFQMTPEGRVTYCSPAIRSFGYNPEQVVGESFLKFVQQDDLAKAADALQRVNSGENISLFEIRLLRGDLSSVICETNATPVIENGHIVGIQGITRDISERKRAEEALSISEEKFRRLFENMAEGFALYELLYDGQGKAIDWRMLEANYAYSRQTGMQRDTIVGRRISELYPEVLPEYLPRFEKVVVTQTPVQFETYSSVSGRHLEISTFPAGGERFASTITDITERKQTEEALRKSETKYRSLFKNMANGFALHKIVTDAAGRPVDYIFMEINAAFEKMTGLKENKIIGRRVTKVLPGIENDPADWINVYGRVTLTGEERRFEQYSSQLDRWYSIVAYSPMDGFFVTLFEDITIRKQIEKELVSARDKLELRVKERTAELFEKSRILESFFRHTQTCLVFLDRDFNFIRVNEAYAKACARQVTDFEGHNHFVDYPSEELRAKFQQVVETKQPYSVFKRPFTFPDHPEWGTTYWDLAVAPVVDAEGGVDFLVFSLVDVTDRVQAEEQLFHLNRLYGMLSKVNTAILRIHEADELYKQLCRIAVEEGRFRMAWIGLVDPVTKKVIPACSYGDTGGYLDTITIYAADVPEGRGPTGRAIREGKNMICSDVEYDPIMLPWKDRALKHGFRSSAAIPLLLGGYVIGAFTIYADTPQFFTDEELTLLTSLADNISFAIDAMSNEKMRLDADITLKKSAEEIRDLYNNAPCGYHSIDKDGTIVRINDTELKWLGYAREEVVGKKKIYEFYTPEGVERFKQTYPKFVERGSVADLEFELVRRDGSIFSVLLNGTAIRDNDGNFLMSRSTMFDITDRKEAEQRIRINNELLKLFAQKYSLSEYLDAVCGLVRKWSGCRHVGFRIMDENRAIPFLASIDYDPDFLKREGTLSLANDQCICTRVITGSPDPSDLSCMTPGGSFISGNTTSFTGALSDDQRSKYRGVCMQAGFRSLAVVPIRYLDQTLGAIHMADEREGSITLKKIEFVEQLAVIVGEAIFRFSAKEELRKSREELRNLSKYLREARESERTTIAREIHDELGQIITALRLELAWIRDNYKDQDVLFKKSKSMLALVDATIQTIQNIISELRPGILDVLGLFAAIEWQAAELKKMSGITCDLVLPSEDVLLSADISTNIFRIIQELFTNIVRYSNATTVSVQIEIKGDRLFLDVIDNGIGIMPQDISSPVSFGIIGIRERVYAMKGDMHIAGTPGMGTSVMITVPVHSKQNS